mmetsp:Transcript_12041/g.18099  ORF Transcript_12041/g.18099 Transcript_12041/m.18099 type:complete len:453 (-) Transcript_12041:774-2132(-)
MICQVKTYAWGKCGSDSLVAQVASEGIDELEVIEDTPYAELWMGTHPSGPSMVMLTTPWKMVTPLSEWIKLNPYLRGPRHREIEPRVNRRKSMIKLERSAMPFLFKLLSVRTALSIQAHPDKVLAAELHRKDANNYKDDNHKPEMAVAITPFEALCSFQPAYSILCNCRATPELVAVISESCVRELERAIEHREQDPEAVRHSLKALFSALMTAPFNTVQLHLSELVSRIESTSKMLRSPVDELALRLHEQYPSDVGVFCVYLLNYKVLQPGEAIFLAANEPHAYIYGDCAEVMATSDNVIRAGLTPKWKDVSTLCSSLTYYDGPPHLVNPTTDPMQPFVARYTPPVEEFVLDRIQMRDGQQAYLSSSRSLSILIIVNGSIAVEQISDVARGDVLHEQTIFQSYLSTGAIHLVCPNTALRMTAQHGDVLAFRATSPSKDAIDEKSPSQRNAH